MLNNDLVNSQFSNVTFINNIALYKGGGLYLRHV